MLTIESVSKRFATGHYGVRDISLSIDGGMLGLLGPNGAGKTTLMQLIATISQPNRDAYVSRDMMSSRIAGGSAICLRTSGSTRAEVSERLRRGSGSRL